MSWISRTQNGEPPSLEGRYEYEQSEPNGSRQIAQKARRMARLHDGRGRFAFFPLQPDDHVLWLESHFSHRGIFVVRHAITGGTSHHGGVVRSRQTEDLVVFLRLDSFH